jgi:hypothetical protein
LASGETELWITAPLWAITGRDPGLVSTLIRMSTPQHRRPTRSAHRPDLPYGPLTVPDARALGWTPAAVHHAAIAGDIERLQRGVVRRIQPVEPGTPARVLLEIANLSRARAAALQCSRAAISHLSAAIAHSMPTFGTLDRACLTVPAGTPLRRLTRVHLHRATLTDADVVRLDGYPVLAAARTVMDVAREFGVDAGVVAADFALHTGLVTADELTEAFEVCRRWPGRRAARITLLSADGDAESPLESLSRLRIAAAGLLAPKPQQEICDIDGRFLGRCDFYWDEFGVFAEVDGALKYRDQPDAVLTAERERHGLLEGTGLVGVRWGWPDLFTFDRVVQRLLLAFARGPRRGSPERRWGLLVPGLHL